MENVDLLVLKEFFSYTSVGIKEDVTLAIEGH